MEFSGSHSQHPPVGISKCYGKTSSVVLQLRSPDQQQQQHVVRTSDSWAPPQTYVPGRVWVGPALCVLTNPLSNSDAANVGELLA